MSPPPPKKQICQILSKGSSFSLGTSPTTSASVVHSIHSRSPNSASAHGSHHALSSSKDTNGSAGKSSSGAHSNGSPKPRADQQAVEPTELEFALSTSPTVHKSPRSLFSAFDRQKSESKESKEMKIYEPISPASSDHQEECTRKDSLRCDYVKVIVSASAPKDSATKNGQLSQESSPPPSPPPAPNPEELTLQLERIFTDSYLLQAWEKCQYIDLFLYSSHDEPSVQSPIPAHRLLLSAYSEYAKQFIKAYPDPVKFVDQLQAFLKESKNKGESPKDLHKLTISALGCTTIPVLVVAVPQQDLNDLVKLMYRGEVAVKKSRIGSMQRSAHELKMSSITIVETSQVLIDSNGIPIYSSEYGSSPLSPSAECTSQQSNGHQCKQTCVNCCYHPNSDSKRKCHTTDQTTRAEGGRSSPVLKMDYDSFDSNSSSSSNSSLSDLSQEGDMSPPVIVVEEEEDDEEDYDNAIHFSNKRNLAAFLRDTPTLNIPKSKETVLANVFAAPKLLPHSFEHAQNGTHYPNKTTTAPHLISRSHSLNELMDQQRSFLRSATGHHLQLPESPLSGFKRKDPSSGSISPYGQFNGLLTPTPNGLFAGLDFPHNGSTSPNTPDGYMGSKINPLIALPTPPPSASATSPKFMSSPLGGSPTALGPFFMKHPLEAVAAAAAAAASGSPFRQGFPFQNPMSGASGSSSSPFQRQFSAPANLNAHQLGGEMSPLIYDHTHHHQQQQHQPELGKSRRGRKPASTYLTSEPTSPSLFGDCSMFGASDRSESPKSETHHQCGANGWLTTAGSGANCRKRCQNLYHAAKYRDRRRQRMEQLYSEKDGLEKAQSLYMSKINSLKVQICSLITQRTQKLGRTGQATFQCPVCQLAFIDVASIRIHLTAEHHDIKNLTISTPKASASATATLSASHPASLGTATATAETPETPTNLVSKLVSPGISSLALATSPPIPIMEHHQHIAMQTFRSLTKEWLVRSTAAAAAVANGPSGQLDVPSSRSGGIFGGAPTLSALPMIPFN